MKGPANEQKKKKQKCKIKWQENRTWINKRSNRLDIHENSMQRQCWRGINNWNKTNKEATKKNKNKNKAKQKQNKRQFGRECLGFQLTKWGGGYTQSIIGISTNCRPHEKGPSCKNNEAQYFKFLLKRKNCLIFGYV